MNTEIVINILFKVKYSSTTMYFKIRLGKTTIDASHPFFVLPAVLESMN